MRLIDADALKEKIKIRFQAEPSWNFSGLRIAQYEVEQMPTVDAVPVRHGQWIKMNEEVDDEVCNGYKCSNCGEWMDYRSHYCPNCGAKMNAERKDNETD